ncbi:MAG: F0F1 ATP synthase subunit delta [Pseudomonadota bacterium]
MSNDNAASEFVSPAGVAGRYAAALFDLAKDEGVADKVEAELKDLRAATDASDDLKNFVKSPVYDRDDQMAAISALAEKAGYSELTSNFLKLAASNRRLFVIGDMVSAFVALAAEDRGEVTASATSAAPMNDEQLKSLRMEIESMVGKAVNLQTRVDPDLLGGLIVKVGSKMIDSSLRTKLNKLKTRMKEA